MVQRGGWRALADFSRSAAAAKRAAVAADARELQRRWSVWRGRWHSEASARDAAAAAMASELLRGWSTWQLAAQYAAKAARAMAIATSALQRSGWSRWRASLLSSRGGSLGSAWALGATHHALRACRMALALWEVLLQQRPFHDLP